MQRFERVLAIGAHTDDVELGCGAFLSRLVDQGVNVMVAAFSRAEAGLPPGAASDTLEREFRASMACLGLADAQIFMGAIPVREFPAHRQGILDELVSIGRAFDPDLVLTMSSTDTHQDHEVIHQESVRAFRGRTVLGYEIPWNQRTQTLDLFVEVRRRDIERKAAMLACYESQAQLSRSYVGSDFVLSSGTFRGLQARCDFAEAYEVITMKWAI